VRCVLDHVPLGLVLSGPLDLRDSRAVRIVKGLLEVARRCTRRVVRRRSISTADLLSLPGVKLEVAHRKFGVGGVNRGLLTVLHRGPPCSGHGPYTGGAAPGVAIARYVFTSGPRTKIVRPNAIVRTTAASTNANSLVQPGSLPNWSPVAYARFAVVSGRRCASSADAWRRSGRGTHQAGRREAAAGSRRASRRRARSQAR